MAILYILSAAYGIVNHAELNLRKYDIIRADLCLVQVGLFCLTTNKFRQFRPLTKGFLGRNSAISGGFYSYYSMIFQFVKTFLVFFLFYYSD